MNGVILFQYRIVALQEQPSIPEIRCGTLSLSLSFSQDSSSRPENLKHLYMPEIGLSPSCVPSPQKLPHPLIGGVSARPNRGIRAGVKRVKIMSTMAEGLFIIIAMMC